MCADYMTRIYVRQAIFSFLIINYFKQTKAPLEQEALYLRRAFFVVIFAQAIAMEKYITQRRISMNMHEIGLRISALRKERDMTQLELADKMGVSYQAVSSWERGSTMPDISRLPDISQVLQVSIDELLGSDTQADMVRNVLNQQTDVYTNDNMPHIQDIEEIAPILKPSQMNTLVEKANPAGISLESLCSIAPFISKEALGQLALKAENAGDVRALWGLAPFMEKEALDQLAHRIENVDGLGALAGLAPFISKETLGELALKATEKGDIRSLCGVAPFLSMDVLNQLALKIEGVEGLGALAGLAPFISKETLGGLAMKAVDSGDINELSGIAPFLDREMLSQLILKAANV